MIDDLSQKAPFLAEFLRTWHSRLRVDLISSDALNGYGSRLLYQVRLERLARRCRNCRRTEYDDLPLDCRWHDRAETEWELMTDAEGLGLEEAIAKIERAIVCSRAPRSDVQSSWRNSPLSRAAPDHGGNRSLHAKSAHGAGGGK